MTGSAAMRVQLKGIHRVQKRLAGGQVQTYYYAWRGGPRLTGDPGSPDFVISFQKAHEERRRPIEDTLMGLLAEYASSGDFQRLSPKQQFDGWPTDGGFVRHQA